MGNPDGDVVRALDGHRFKTLISAALSWLRQHQEEVNALNVFPVPDGDTGTNMALTMTSAWDEIASLDENHVGRLTTKLAHGALMGARGNSGVILSQIWRGFAYGVDGHGALTIETMARAMRVASETAYKGVVKPVEGTILTVIRELAEEADDASTEVDDLIVFIDRLVHRGKTSVARTPSLLPVLRQAGVVDAGGHGLYLIFEGMLRELKGLPMVLSDVAAKPDLSRLQLDMGEEEHDILEFDSRYPYDVQFIILGDDLDVARIREGISAMGDSALTVGDASAVKVHVHIADPGEPISFGARHGSISDVLVEDMRVQYEAYTASRSRPEQGRPPVHLLVQEEAPAISVVVISSGDGLSAVFRSLGATVIVEGGQTMNPSTAQILDAVAEAASDQVIILPNNSNVLMAAQQAAEVSEKHVVVVPTRSIPQGVSALLALDQGGSVEENAEAMIESAREVLTAEVTWATRDVQINGLHVREGDAIGLLEDELVVDAQSLDEVVHWLLAESDLESHELVTLYYGDSISEDEARGLVEALVETYPELEFELIEGGQPHYPYIISIE
jgi:uncharacterized protein